MEERYRFHWWTLKACNPWLQLQLVDAKSKNYSDQVLWRLSDWRKSEQIGMRTKRWGWGNMQLKSSQKGSSSMNDYLLWIKSIVDSLLVGYSISTSDRIDTIFEGLPSEFNTLITVVTTCIDSYTIDEIESIFWLKKGTLRRLQNF